MDNVPNIDNETMNKIKNLVDSSNLSGAISQISPEMIENFSKMMENNNMNNNNQNNNTNNHNYNNTNSNSNSNNYSTNKNSNSFTNSNQNANQNSNFNKENSSNNNNFDINNIDINTIMKMSSAFGSINNKNDPRANLLNSLKPYLRDSKKNKLDNYVNLLNMGKIAEVLKNTNINNNNINDNKGNNAT